MTPRLTMHNSDAVGSSMSDSRLPLPARVIDSQQLLQGRKEALIAHNGVTYRLQATRQGKLILIK